MVEIFQRTQGEMTNSTFTLSIEPIGKPAYQHGFHLGTIEEVARRCVEQQFHDCIHNGMPICTMALIRDRRIVDVYDGEWQSERNFDD